LIVGDLAKALGECLNLYLELPRERHPKLSNRIRQLLRQLFANDSILQLVSPNAIRPLKKYSVGEIDDKLAPNIPAFGMILQNLSDQGIALRVHLALRSLGLALAVQAELVLKDLILRRKIIIDEREDLVNEQNWEVTGSCYGRSMKRIRPFYEGRDGSRKERCTDEQICQKFYETYKKDKLTGGLMALWCPHLVCLGFHKMPRAEGRDDVFSAIYCYFDIAPSVVIYDFACQLAPYCMVREPEFFKNTLFVIDEMHANGHSSCSQVCFLSNYMQTRPDLQPVYSSAAECSNSGLNRIRKSVSYMNEAHAIIYTHTYICVWNRRRELAFQRQADRQAELTGATFLPKHREEI
jgi:Kyakuja-Dileera-Zisupton transposase